VLILGMIEFGRVMMVEQVLSNAAREGCRHAALGDSTVTTQAVTDTVNGYLTGSTLAGTRFRSARTQARRDQARRSSWRSRCRSGASAGSQRPCSWAARRS
jgi:Flp pilus assembly protein TadG